MKKYKSILVFVLVISIIACTCACAKKSDSATKTYTKQEIEEGLNLKNNEEQQWAYDSNSDAWMMNVVSAVMNPEI